MLCLEQGATPQREDALRANGKDVLSVEPGGKKPFKGEGKVCANPGGIAAFCAHGCSLDSSSLSTWAYSSDWDSKPSSGDSSILSASAHRSRGWGHDIEKAKLYGGAGMARAHRGEWRAS